MIIIIGAGAAGLATAYFLQRYQLPYVVFEKETPGSTWGKHYVGLELNTLRQVSGLPGLAMPTNYPHFPSGEQTRAYLTQYAAYHRLRVVNGAMVQKAQRHPTHWQVRTHLGEFQAQHLVIATGIWNSPVLPTFTGQAHFSGQILHSSAYHSPASFIGQRVLVVGAGNSGSEIAVQLAAAGVSVGIAVRSGVNFVQRPRSPNMMRLAAIFFRHAPAWLGNAVLAARRADFSQLGLPRSPLPPLEAYPVVGYKLPAAVRAGQVRTYPEIKQLAGETVFFGDGQRAAFDVLLCATGYRPTVDFFDPALPRTPAGWLPLTKENQVNGMPNLWAVGFDYPATAGVLQTLGAAAQRTAQAISRIPAF